MQSNWVVDDLPKGVFGNVSFDNIYIQYTSLVAVDPSALLSSMDRLDQLTISQSSLTDFPFNVLAQMSRLKTLDLAQNVLVSVPAFESLVLENLRLSNNQIKELESGWSLPGLQILDISKCDHA